MVNDPRGLLMWIKISMSSPKILHFELLQHQNQQFISKFASSVVSRFAIASWFNINVLEFYQITQLSSIYANWSSFPIKLQLTISCILIRINGAINEKTVSMSTKLTIKNTWYNSTLGELSVAIYLINGAQFSVFVFLLRHINFQQVS